MSMLIDSYRFGSSAPTFYDEVLADGPYIWWRLGESSGTAMADSSGNGQAGTLNGTASTDYDLSEPGLVGDSNTAIELKSSSGFIRSNVSYNALTLAANATFAIAVKINSGAAGGTIFGLHDDSNPTGTTGSRDRLLYVDTSGALVAGIYSAAVRTIVHAGINDGQKHLIHLACGADNTEGSELYVDGVSVGTIPYISNDTASNRYVYAGRLNLSAWPSGAAGAATALGIYDELQVYTKRLSAARILAQAQAGGFA